MVSPQAAEITLQALARYCGQPSATAAAAAAAADMNDAGSLQRLALLSGLPGGGGAPSPGIAWGPAGVSAASLAG
eukprot:264526-Chlamydomonas_euryale.AAC.1